MSEAASGAAALQGEATKAYRDVPYVLGVYRETWPDRLCTVARLAGVAAPAIETARVLEVGGGTGLNALAIAAAFPQATVTSFDIDPDAVAVGQRWAAAAGLANAQVLCADLTDPQGLADQYDYIIAHGVFAWVPPSVADALLAMIGGRLAPTGIAMVSYNALPGSYLRFAIRDRALRAAAGAPDAAERLKRGRAALAGLDPNSSVAMIATLGRLAADTIGRDDSVLLHDEMGACYHPQWVGDVAVRARAHGLDYLGDAGTGRIGEMFEGEGDRVDAAMDCDWRLTRGFRETLFVRADVPVRHRVDPDALSALWVGSDATEPEPRTFASGKASVQLDDPALLAVLRRLLSIAPGRVPVRDLELEGGRVAALLPLFDVGLVDLCTGPPRFATNPGPAPRATALARLAIAERLSVIPTLDGRSLSLSPDSAAVVAACDGGDPARLSAALATAGFTTPVEQAAALRELASTRLLMAEDGA